MPDVEKVDNFGGGLPVSLYAVIDGLLGGAAAKGTPAEQAAVYRAIALEEHAALNPGSGTTSMADAMLRYVAIAQATDQLTAAGTALDQTAAINKLVPAIQALGKLWADYGPVRGEFLVSVKS
jgi:hypothetical protein